MTKRKFNLRTVAAIIACLVVTTMFAACDKTNPDDDNKNGGGNGKVDAKLVGSWGYFGNKTMPKVYIFNQDGTFLYYSALVPDAYSANEFVYKGKYSANEGKITFTNVFISRFDRQNDITIRNKIGDRGHAKEMLKTTTGFVSWTLEPLVYNFIETGIVRIKKEVDEDYSHQVCRADWETYNGW